MRTAALWLSLVLIFTIPWENAITLGEVGTLTRIIGVSAAMGWLGSAVVVRRFRNPHPFHMFMFLFILWNVVSFFWSIGVDETEQRIKTYVQLGFLAWILWDLYSTPKALRMALEAYILGAYVTIGSTISQYLAGQESSADSMERRYAGAGLNANDLALILALAIPVAWHLAISAANGKKNILLRIINYAYTPAALFAIFLTASRMALFAIVPAILYIVGTANRLKPFYRILLFAVLVGALSYIPQSSIDRLATVGASINKGDLGGRGGIWHKSIAVISEHPLLGVGSGALNTASLLGQAAHNTFLSVLAELGLIGLTLFVILLAIVAYQAVNQPKGVSGLWLTVLAIWAIGVFTLTWEYHKATWLFLSLVVISASLVRRGASAGEVPSFSDDPLALGGPQGYGRNIETGSDSIGQNSRRPKR